MDAPELTRRLRQLLHHAAAGPAVLVAVTPADPEPVADILRPGDLVVRRGRGVVALCERLDRFEDARVIVARLESALGEVDIRVREASPANGRSVDPLQPFDGLDSDGRVLAGHLDWVRFDGIGFDAALAGAAAGGELDLRYQPVVELRTARVIGVEALLRWRHADRDVPPEEFVPAAEASGVIVELGAWALRQACAQAVAWREHPQLEELRVGVNVSAVQLEEPAFSQRVADALDGASPSLDPGSLWVELTESLVVDDLDAAVPVLEDLRALGVRVALDDFGTGYSSLTHLRRLPVDVIKLDRSFVNDLDTDRRARAIVRSSIGLAAALGLRCVAEGVASRRQVDQLIGMGCDYGQGSWYSLPLRADEVPDAVRQIAERQ